MAGSTACAGLLILIKSDVGPAGCVGRKKKKTKKKHIQIYQKWSVKYTCHSITSSYWQPLIALLNRWSLACHFLLKYCHCPHFTWLPLGFGGNFDWQQVWLEAAFWLTEYCFQYSSWRKTEEQRIIHYDKAMHLRLEANEADGIVFVFSTPRIWKE